MLDPTRSVLQHHNRLKRQQSRRAYYNHGDAKPTAEIRQDNALPAQETRHHTGAVPRALERPARQARAREREVRGQGPAVQPGQCLSIQLLLLPSLQHTEMRITQKVAHDTRAQGAGGRLRHPGLGVRRHRGGLGRQSGGLEVHCDGPGFREGDCGG